MLRAVWCATVVRQNGMVVRDLRAKVTEIGQMYAVVPAPDSVAKAGPAKE